MSLVEAALHNFVDRYAQVFSGWNLLHEFCEQVQILVVVAFEDMVMHEAIQIDGGDMVIKWGRNGEFVACSNYPKCTNTGEIARDDQGIITLKPPSAPVPTDEVCEKCGKPMVKRRSRFGEFLGCSGYPDCDGIKRLQS